MTARYVEPQFGKDAKGYWLTVSISHGDSRWVSKPARLSSPDEAGARAEAERQVTMLLKALNGNKEPES